MKETVIRLGGHMPLEARRVVIYFGKSTMVETAIGEVGGMADGAVVIRVPGSRIVLHELTPKQALDAAEALTHAARGVLRWQEHASGFNRVRVARSAAGDVDVTFRGQTHRMRPSRTRAKSRRRHFCQVCRERREGEVFYVLADPGPPWHRIDFCEVCAACVDKIANAPEEIAEVLPLTQTGDKP